MGQVMTILNLLFLCSFLTNNFDHNFVMSSLFDYCNLSVDRSLLCCGDSFSVKLV